jgi:hypothetical protein
MITRFSKRTVHHEDSIYVHSTHVSTQYTIISINQNSYISFSSSPSLIIVFEHHSKIMATEHLSKHYEKETYQINIYVQ